MDSAKLLIIGGVALGGFYLLNKSKKDKEYAQALALANAQELELANAQLQNTPAQTNLPVEDLTGFYTSAQATKKALEVVTKYISLLDAIPKEQLTQENKNTINQRIFAEREKQAKINYDKAFAEAKLKNLSKFTFGDATFWTVNEEDVRNGSFGSLTGKPTDGKWTPVFAGAMAKLWIRNPNGFYYGNSLRNLELTEDAILNSNNRISEITKNYKFFNSNDPATLGDYVKRVKQIEFTKIYDALKEVFTKLPKSDVDRLVVLLPKYFMAVSDDFAYFQTEYEKNPFTIEEQLYLKDINIEGLLNPKKPMLAEGSVISNAISAYRGG